MEGKVKNVIQVGYPNLKIQSLKPTNPKHLEHQDDASNRKFHPWFHVMGHTPRQRNLYRMSLRLYDKVHMTHK